MLWAIGAALAVGLSGSGSPAQAAFPGTNGRLACEGQRGDVLPEPAPPGSSRSEVFTVNPDGSGELVLTNNTVRDGDPGWSPDGSQLSFESFRDGFSEAYNMASDGSAVTRLTTSGNNEDRSTSWSPDGTKIAFHSTRDTVPAGSPPLSSPFEIYIMNADGSNQVRITNNLAQDTFPMWSPDGSRLTFTSNREVTLSDDPAAPPVRDFEIYTMKPDGTDVVRVTNSRGEDAHPSWSPDGTQLTFHSRRDGPTSLEVYRSNADGSNPVRVTSGPGIKYFPIWSPDGTRIAFNGTLDQTDPNNVDVYHVNAVDGSDPVRLTTAAGFDGRCDWLALPRAVVTPPPPGPPPAPGPPAPQPTPPAASKFTAKLSLARATINRRERLLDVLAPITSLASGRANVELHAAGRRFRFTAAIDSRAGRIRFSKRIPTAQALLGTGILTITYRGDADTRSQTVRLRAARQRADLRLTRPTIANGRLRASGTVSNRARGIVRAQIEYVVDGQTRTRQFNARINNGRWSLDQALSQAVRDEIARRTGTVHSYTLFTGYIQARMRGEMRSFQVLGDR